MPSRRDVYDIVVRRLTPDLERLGMHPVRAGDHPAWGKEITSGERLFLSVQVDGQATDQYSGGGFRVEVERSKATKPGQGLNGRALFFQLLTDAELRVLLERQNAVIDALAPPPSAQVEAYPAGPVRDQYLAYFDPQEKFDAVRCWLRFRSTADVAAWVDSLSPLLGPLLDRAEAVLRSEERFLGKGALL